MTTQIPLTIQILNWVVMLTTDLSCIISGAESLSNTVETSLRKLSMVHGNMLWKLERMKVYIKLSWITSF